MLLTKIKELSGSLRFWIITLTGAIAILEQATTGSVTAVFVFKIIEIWLGAVVALGTFDSVASKFGAAFAKRG